MQRRTPLLALLLVLSLILAACPAPAQPAAAPAEQPTAAEAKTTEAPAAEAPATEAPAAEAPAAPAADMTGKVVIPAGGVIRLGGSSGLTGPIPEMGSDIAQSAQVAVDDLNAAGGIDGFMLELDMQDGGCDGSIATNVANKFAADSSIVAVTGGMCSGETLGLKPILLAARIPFVTPSATNPSVLSEDCDSCNRVVLTDQLQANTDADYLFNVLGIKKIALMHDNGDYGLGLVELLQTAFEALGGEVTGVEGGQVGETDFRAALAKIAANGPELVFFGGYSTEAALITQQMKETPGLEDALFMSDDGAFTQQYLDTAGAAAEGAYMSKPIGDVQADMYNAFRQRYTDKYGAEPLGPYDGQSYDSVMLIANAIKQVAEVDASGSLVIDREALIKAIRATKDLTGLTGSMTCNDIGECGAGGIQISRVENGEFVQVSGFGMK
ncbi:MAG: branched-chain amino acid ABC transporter substrate-binding protein [Caldilineaceae bacterium]|nr:branched-chain amino acid ABC transporter substrate-binding protein [Caldilineaceae bacterium]